MMMRLVTAKSLQDDTTFVILNWCGTYVMLKWYDICHLGLFPLVPLAPPAGQFVSIPRPLCLVARPRKNIHRMIMRSGELNPDPRPRLVASRD